MNEKRPHIPVMLEQTMDMLAITPGKVWVDATAGAGGHLREIIRRGRGRGGAGSGADAAGASDGTVVAIDRDIYSLQKLEAELRAEELADNVRFAHANFSDIDRVLDEQGIDTISGGVLADLGVSSMQLDQAERGFSFSKDGPLDMRMDPSARVTAEHLVNTLPEKELADIIYNFGEERLSRQIARRIVEARPLTTTGQLEKVVSPVVLRQRRGGRNRDESHPATRTFQALRMAVNDELGSIEQFLRTVISRLAPGARIVVITFHSLEDRLVKQIFREAASSCICPPRHPVCMCDKRQELKILTGKPLLANEKELLANPRSRSAKLRAGERIAQT